MSPVAPVAIPVVIKDNEIPISRACCAFILYVSCMLIRWIVRCGQEILQMECKEDAIALKNIKIVDLERLESDFAHFRRSETVQIVQRPCRIYMH